MADYDKAFKNLKIYDKEVQKLTLELFENVNDLLQQLIIDNDIQLRKSQNMLIAEYNKALETTDYVNNLKISTINTIVSSTYIKTGLGGSQDKWEKYLLNKSFFNDNIKLSTRIRNNSESIVRDHKIILKKVLKEGKSISEIIGNIGDNTFEGFTKELPKYLDNITNKKILGQKISISQISALKKQIKKIKTPGLRADYLRLIESIKMNKNIKKASFYAIERRTKYYTARLARSETIRTLSIEETYNSLKNKDTQYVKNVTQGSNPCPYCIAMENLGFLPVESAAIPTHHPHCSCKPIFKRSIKKPSKISQNEFISLQQNEIDKINSQNQKKGLPKTYLDTVKPMNLRKEDYLKDWDYFKNK